MVKRLLSVKISISGEEPIPADVVIHGKIPRAPDRSCRNCAKKNDCKILQYSLAQVATLAFRPISEGNLMEYSDLSFPMPCRGIEWTSIARVSEVNDPLVQRLGLSDIGEPIIERSPISENDR